LGAIKTLHIVGYKNSGKTTLIARWVRLLKKEGISVAVLKHHGHKGPLELPDSNTDAMQFYNNGADVSVVAGGGSVQLYMNEEPGFSRMKEIAMINKPSILLIEGYKEERGDKVVLLRNQEDWTELINLRDIQLIIGNINIEASVTHIPSRTDGELLDEWLLNWLGRKDKHETF